MIFRPSGNPPAPSGLTVLRSLLVFLPGGLLIAFLSAMLLFSTPLDAAEYLEADTPIPNSLAEVPSATQSIGLTPDEISLQNDLPRPILMEILPSLRQNLFPRTGFAGIDDAVFSVQPRIYFRYRNNNGENTEEVAAIGGALKFESGWMADVFRVTLVGYTSQKLYARPGGGGAGLLRPDGQGITVLGQAFGEFKYSDSSVIFGRIPLDVPYINADDSRMIPNTFEGVAFRSTEVENLQIGFGHIFSIKARDSVDFVSMSEKAGAEGSTNGVSVAGFRYNFTDDFNVGGVNLCGWNTFNTFYLETERSLTFTEDLSMVLGGQFTDQRSVGDQLLGHFATQSAGAKAAIGYRSLIASANFTWTGRGDGIQKPWGGSPSFNSTVIADFDRAGELAFRAGLSMDFSDFGLNGLAASANWVCGNTPDSGAAASPDQQEFNITIDFIPPVKYLDQLWLRFRYAENRMSNGYDRREFRVVLNYSYSF
jgi:hypothetical protein